MRTPSYLLFLFGMLIISGIIGILTYFTYRTPPELRPPTPEDAPAAAELPLPLRPTVRSTDPVRGAQNASITIVEFGDFFCAACAQVKPALAAVLSEFEGKVKLVWKDLPNTGRHLLAKYAAQAARCAQEQGKFWQYHDLLFAQLEQGQSLTEQELSLLAQEISLNTSQFSECISSDRTARLVEQSFNEGILLRVDATPYFFIGDKRFSGAISEENLKTAIDEALR